MTETGLVNNNPKHELTENDARKGGIKSGETRRRRKTFKEALQLMLEKEELVKEKHGEEIVEMVKSVQDIGIENLMKKYMKGDLQTFLAVRDTIGEKPVEKVEQELVSNIKVDVTDE